MDDRSLRCGFCQGTSAGRCRRCEMNFCAEHRGPGEARCAVCEQERREAVESALTMEELRGPGVVDDDRSAEILMGEGGGAAGENFLRIVWNKLSLPWRRRRARQRAEAELAALTPYQIAHARSAQRLQGKPRRG